MLVVWVVWVARFVLVLAVEVEVELASLNLLVKLRWRILVVIDLLSGLNLVWYCWLKGRN